ncbi:flavoprotein [Solwaraspora sp. WMMD406]|uniref:NAD(P)-binding protein n=1 Tax=Solwaraspora sp. WMMD406 TaxID=3016095 RepID=UPI002415E4AE|nr:NAD(P)-binding protein [Solwaraspora sp. WMMD406]MDG4766846.1 flavoprotein [Solwaraspora sp. WMMD406]
MTIDYVKHHADRSSADRRLPVAVIGAGPVGLAAAARLVELGAVPLVLEAGTTAGTTIRNWQHVRLFSAWHRNVDPVAARLLDAGGWRTPAPGDRPTGAELIEDYLLPLARSPQLAPWIRYGCQVIGIGRLGLDRTRGAGRATTPFVLRLADGTEHLARAVIDTTGTWDTPNRLGGDGLPAIGEPAAADRLDFSLPDVLGTDRDAHAGRHTVVVGAGHSAANTLLALVELARRHPGTRVTWAVRRAGTDPVLPRGVGDVLPARAAAGTDLPRFIAAGLITLARGFVTHRVETVGDRRPAHDPRVRPAHDPQVRLVARDGRTIDADRVVVATGFRAEHRIAAELRLDLDPVLGTSRGLATLIDPERPRLPWSGPPPHGVAELSHPEPDYFVAGVKSYGRASAFLLATGYRQVEAITLHLARHGRGGTVHRRWSTGRWTGPLPITGHPADSITGHRADSRASGSVSRR